MAVTGLAFALILLFAFSMIWFGILIGSVMRSVEAVNGVMFTVLFPITFLANTFAPTEPMQHWRLGSQRRLPRRAGDRRRARNILGDRANRVR